MKVYLMYIMLKIITIFNIYDQVFMRMSGKKIRLVFFLQFLIYKTLLTCFREYDSTNRDIVLCKVEV